ncbi:MAG: apolipoprotein N-acyltransferase [Proteobacteria bacterium]|nr:apolipoprotein N-acyltransferase [Pseudomonadota bacterium]
MSRLKERVMAFAGWRRALIAMVLGIAATGALPPLHLLPLLVVAFSGLVWLIDGSATRRAAFAAGWWFGLGHFVSGLYWIGIALMTDPERYAWLVAPAVLAISAGLALFPALVALAARLCPPGVSRALGLALAWVVAEWLRGWLFTGFPWNLMGTVWASSEPMMQFAAYGGVFGLGLITVAVAAAPSTLAGGGRGPTLIAGLVLLALWGGGMARLAAYPAGDVVEEVRLRLVQPNVAQHHKWQPEKREALFRRHLALTRSAGFETITHVIWPETAIPYFIADDPARRSLIAAATPKGGALISGALRGIAKTETAPQKLWNSLYAFDDEGRVVATYDKTHLVPFGEYMPFRNILSLAKLTYGTTDFSAGPGPRSLTVAGLPSFSALICYEAIFPAAVVEPGKRPGFLLNITNDAWFGMSSGPYQHFASARLRAVEQGLPLVRSANTGISAVVDALGRITARLGLGREGVLDADLPRALGEPTFYAGWGDIWLLPLAMVGAFLLRRGRRAGSAA